MASPQAEPVPNTAILTCTHRIPLCKLLLLAIGIGLLLGCQPQEASQVADLERKIDSQATQIAQLTAALVPTPTVTTGPTPAIATPASPLPTVTPTPAASLELPEPGEVLHTVFADAGLRVRILSQDSTSATPSAVLLEWHRRVEQWTPPPLEKMELIYPDVDDRQKVYIILLLEETAAIRFLSPYYTNAWKNNGVVRNLPQALAGYYAHSLDASYRGVAVPTVEEYWGLFLGNKSKPPQTVTCSWPLHAITNEWKSGTPAYEYAVQPSNARNIWLFVAVGCGVPENRFDAFWSAYASARSMNPSLTWPDYLWERLGR